MRKVRGLDGDERSSINVAPLCGRNDCSRPASARLMLDMANRVVSIDMEIEEVGAGMLCYTHAERVVVPRGWTLRDDRVIEPYLFDGAPYDIDDDVDSADEAARDEAKVRAKAEAKVVAAAARKERKRKKLINPVQDGETTPEVEADDGQLSMADDVDDGYEVPYDLPSEYESAGDRPKTAPLSKRTPVVDIEADRSTSPLLARAFDMTKTRGANPKSKRPSASPLDDLD